MTIYFADAAAQLRFRLKMEAELTLIVLPDSVQKMKETKRQNINRELFIVLPSFQLVSRFIYP